VRIVEQFPVDPLSVAPQRSAIESFDVGCAYRLRPLFQGDIEFGTRDLNAAGLTIAVHHNDQAGAEEEESGIARSHIGLSKGSVNLGAIAEVARREQRLEFHRKSPRQICNASTVVEESGEVVAANPANVQDVGAEGSKPFTPTNFFLASQ
jgi:hypothetical protein